MIRANQGRPIVSGIRVAVQTGSSELDNLGDRAMLEVLIERLRQAHPYAHFAVFSRDAARVRTLGDDVEQIPVEQMRGWALFRAAAMAAGRMVPSLDRLVRR